MITYVDTSTLLKLIIDEEGSDRAALIWSAADAVASVTLITVEARAAIAAAARGQRLTATQARDAVGELDALLRVNLMPVTDELVSAAADLAAAEGLRGYDAVHLAAALEIGATVFSSADTASRSGVYRSSESGCTATSACSWNANGARADGPGSLPSRWVCTTAGPTTSSSTRRTAPTSGGSLHRCYNSSPRSNSSRHHRDQPTRTESVSDRLTRSAVCRDVTPRWPLRRLPQAAHRAFRAARGDGVRRVSALASGWR